MRKVLAFLLVVFVCANSLVAHERTFNFSLCGYLLKPTGSTNQIWQKVDDNTYLDAYRASGYLGSNIALSLYYNRTVLHLDDEMDIFPGLRVAYSEYRTQTPIRYFIEGIGGSGSAGYQETRHQQLYLSALLFLHASGSNWSLRGAFLNPGVELNNLGDGSTEFCVTQFLQVCVSGLTLEFGWLTNFNDPSSWNEVWDTYIYAGLGWTF